MQWERQGAIGRDGVIWRKKFTDKIFLKKKKTEFTLNTFNFFKYFFDAPQTPKAC
jgi:hypothetical protein